MFCYPASDNAVCVVVDIQAKLLPAMNDPELVLNRAQMLVKGMKNLVCRWWSPNSTLKVWAIRCRSCRSFLRTEGIPMPS